MNEPKWLQIARQFHGLSEIAGPRHNAQIVKFWKEIGMGGIKDDETPWCLHPETEIMTNRGWIPLSDMDSIDAVAVVDESGQIGFTRAWMSVHCEKAEGLLWTKTGVMFTKDHEWVRASGSRFSFKYSSHDMVAGIKLMQASAPDGSTTSLWRIAAIAALIECGVIRYEKRKGRLKTHVSMGRRIGALADLGFVQDRTDSTGRSVMVMECPTELPRGEIGIDTFSGISRQDARAAIDAVVAGFGETGAHGGQLIRIRRRMGGKHDFIGWLAAMAGVSTVTRTYKRSSMVVVRFSTISPRMHSQDIEATDYTGPWACVLTKEGRIIVRDPKVRANVVTGNCGAFVSYCLKVAGIKAPNSGRALDFANWGVECPPIPGAVAVFSRRGGGHVGLVVGVDQAGDPVVLGGNQGNAVSVRSFGARSGLRLVGYRWPKGVPVPGGAAPVVAAASGGAVT